MYFFCFLLEKLTASKQVAEPERSAVAEPMPQLRIPAVD
jgi:hypothetical protein